MGSLMSGWDSPRSNSGKGGFERNKSLTRGEIENFWKDKRKAEEEHLQAVVESDSMISQDESLITQTRGSGNQSMAAIPTPRLEISKSFPGRGSADVQFVKDVEILTKRNAWWTRSNWAFLNEPPLTKMEGPAYKYAAQYNVAELGGQKQDLSTDGLATTS